MERPERRAGHTGAGDPVGQWRYCADHKSKAGGTSMITLIEGLNRIKDLLRSYEWKMATQPSEVKTVVEIINLVRQEVIEPQVGTSDVLKVVNSQMTSWVIQARQRLSDVTLDGFRASQV